MNKIMLMVATGQNAANIHPLSEPSMRPDSVQIAVTSDKMDWYDNLKSDIENLGKGIKVLSPLVLQNPLDIGQMSNTFLEWYIDTCTDEEVLINITGGLKPIALAIYSALSHANNQVSLFYLDYGSNHINWINNSKAPPIAIKPNIDLERYLKVYGYTIQARQRIQAVNSTHLRYAREVFEYVCGNLNERSRTISHLNYLVSRLHDAMKRHEDKIRFSRVQEPEPSWRVEQANSTDQLNEIIRAVPSLAELVQIRHGTIEFKDIQSARMVAGGWLDLVVADRLRSLELQGKIRDVSVGVYVSKSTQRKHAKSFNEIDVMAMYDSSLLMVECKTINWREGGSDAESIYKLKALDQMGGLDTHALFVSLYDLKDAAKTRASEGGIDLIAGQQLLELDTRLRQWINR